MTDEELESVATSAILFGEARKLALAELRNGKLAAAFLEESLSTELPTQAVKLIEEVERLKLSLSLTVHLALDGLHPSAAYDKEGREESFRCPACEACSDTREGINHYDDCAVAILRAALDVR